MVLVVKLKNPHRRTGADDPREPAPDAVSRESSQEYRSAAEQQHDSPSPPVDAFNDAALDALSSALQQTQLEGSTEGRTEEAVTAPARPAVDVLVAPAVLGHRWVRTRSNAFVVERPERVRAVALGIAAVAAGHQSVEERERGQLDTLTSHLASLSVETATSPDTHPLAVHLSDKALSLAHPTRALSMIHALEEEYLSVEEQCQPAPFAGKAESATAPLPYTSFLDNLCMQAPSDTPPAPAPRSLRKTEEGGAAETVADSHPSEVPLHLPQGDLYLCGPTRAPSYFAASVGDDALAGTELPQTPTKEPDHVQHSNGVMEAAPPLGGSRGAIEAALGTSCAAVDRVVCAAGGAKLGEASAMQGIDVTQLQQASPAGSAPLSRLTREPALRSFVLVRPPGHHCNATQPSGFCWVNNVAVMAAHAYEEHGIDRVAILDFDLHHGNGTQAIAWRINAETVRKDLEREARAKAMRGGARKVRRSGGASGDQAEEAEEQGRRGLKIFYGSLHDIESFPCEDGTKELVADASLCIDGAHGQWIWNIHLDSQSTAEEASKLYKQKYSQLIDKARGFFAKTSSTPESNLVLISAGFDACMHEQAGMQRHGKSVPPRFYEDFTRDAVTMAEEWCGGKCISVLEGGYSDRALTSGAIAHLIGLGLPRLSEELYQPSTLYQLEKAAKAAFAPQQQRKRNDALARDAVWLEYVVEAFRRIEEGCGRSRVASREGGTAPATPNRAMMDQLWKSPRETRSVRGATSAKASPIKRGDE